MPRRKCRAYVVTDQEQRTQRVVVRDGDTMEGLLKVCVCGPFHSTRSSIPGVL